MKRKVITNRLSYKHVKNFAGLPFKKYKLLVKNDVQKYILQMRKILRKSPDQYYLNSYRDLGLIEGDVWHFFNALSLSRKPWLTTFSTRLPRWGRVDKRKLQIGVELLANKFCKWIISQSECSRKIQERFIQEEFRYYADDILHKLRVVQPAQRVIVGNYDKKVVEEKYIVFTMVGSAFFRKGGKEVLLVFEKLIDQGMPVKLNIVSKMQYGDYASYTTKDDLHDAMSIIDKHKKYINHFSFLENERVLELLSRSHIGLLPTYAEAFGYSVLEAQAAGCPVITTNVRALPEINNEDMGWLISVPRDENGDGRIRTERDRKIFSVILQEELYKLIVEILASIEVIGRKGIRCIEKVKNVNSLDLKAAELESLYDAALNNSL